jgi:chaperonin GroEL (HSP60 family)
MLEDLATLTGGQTISEDLGIKLEDKSVNRSVLMGRPGLICSFCRFGP